MTSLVCNNHPNNVDLKAQAASWGKINQSSPFQDAAPNAAVFPSSSPPPSLLLWQYKKAPHIQKTVQKGENGPCYDASCCLSPPKSSVLNWVAFSLRTSWRWEREKSGSKALIHLLHYRHEMRNKFKLSALLHCMRAPLAFLLTLLRKTVFSLPPSHETPTLCLRCAAGPCVTESRR